MSTELVVKPKSSMTGMAGFTFPALLTVAGERASRRFVEFFTVNIRNPNTRQAYARAVGDFCQWCEARGLALENFEPVIVAAHIEHHPGSAPTVKQHLAAIRMLFDWLVFGQIIPMNPAASIQGPKYVVRQGYCPTASTCPTSWACAIACSSARWSSHSPAWAPS